jgi:hypothetical protein
MQMGECPYDDCNDFQMRILPDVPLPMMSKEKCPGCGRTIWIKYSRVDPLAFTEAQFAECYDIDEATKNVTQKVGQ